MSEYINLEFVFFCFIGFLGMLTHWAKKWLRTETKCSLYTYLFTKQPAYTAMSVLTYFGAIATLLAMGTIDYRSPQSLGLSFLAGYMIDSAVNKDKSDD
jgi:hypothetical protein